jgi:hypothetical protein
VHWSTASCFTRNWAKMYKIMTLYKYAHAAFE